MLKPFREQVGDFRQRLEQLHGEEVRERTSLKSQLDQLAGLEDHIDDAGFLEAWAQAQRDAKRFLTKLAIERGVRLDSNSMFDVLVKRIHEYKRQHLNVLHIIALYNRIRQKKYADIKTRALIFAGKAAQD